MIDFHVSYGSGNWKKKKKITDFNSTSNDTNLTSLRWQLLKVLSKI